MAYQVLGFNYLWSPPDGLPLLSDLAGFHANTNTDTELLARLTELMPQIVTARLEADHLAYLAWLNATPVAYGWVATRRHGIDELDIDYQLPARCRALWDFRTLTPWRGRGIYPRLLQSILREQTPAADWFEICHVAGNTASQRGIEKAGFTRSNQLVNTDDAQFKLVPVGDLERARQSPMGQVLGFLPVERSLWG